MTAIEQLREQGVRYSNGKARRDNALDECGIGHDVQERMRHGAEAIGKFLGDLSVRLHTQMHHDLLTNVPTGIISRFEWAPEIAVVRSIPSALGALVKWDVWEARELAAAILEDVNDHGEAKRLRDLVAKERQAA